VHAAGWWLPAHRHPRWCSGRVRTPSTARRHLRNGRRKCRFLQLCTAMISSAAHRFGEAPDRRPEVFRIRLGGPHSRFAKENQDVCLNFHGDS
jgi:hypothetical protein